MLTTADGIGVLEANFGDSVSTQVLESVCVVLTITKCIALTEILSALVNIPSAIGSKGSRCTHTVVRKKVLTESQCRPTNGPLCSLLCLCKKKSNRVRSVEEPLFPKICICTNEVERVLAAYKKGVHLNRTPTELRILFALADSISGETIEDVFIRVGVSENLGFQIYRLLQTVDLLIDCPRHGVVLPRSLRRDRSPAIGSTAGERSAGGR